MFEKYKLSKKIEKLFLKNIHKVHKCAEVKYLLEPLIIKKEKCCWYVWVIGNPEMPKSLYTEDSSQKIYSFVARKIKKELKKLENIRQKKKVNETVNYLYSSHTLGDERKGALSLTKKLLWIKTFKFSTETMDSINKHLYPLYPRPLYGHQKNKS